MELHKIETGNFMADGGAIFGVVPKVMWERHYPCNENNYCNLSMRCLLIKTENKLILIDTGVGDKQSEKFFSYQHLNGDDTLLKSFEKAGFSPEDVTDVILTHLHFDHVGGAVYRDCNDKLQLTFPKATHWVGESQWQNYLNPNIREGSVYFKENVIPIHEAGQLKTITKNTFLTDDIEMRLFNGHTPGQIIPHIKFKSTTLVYMGDLIPLMASVPVAWVAAYDTDPIIAMEEKTRFLEEAVKNNFTLFFEHDLYNECCTLEETPRGIKAKESLNLEAI